ncbi:MAG: hypothetical protein QOF87_2639, partial [Pseudonocardiales bacterium]|nr:hypothetical protein [Pseudonocardiales bacterium]
DLSGPTDSSAEVSLDLPYSRARGDLPPQAGGAPTRHSGDDRLSGVLCDDAASGEHLARRRVPGDDLAHRGTVQHDQVSAVARLETVPVEAHDAGGRRGDRIEQRVEP